MSASSGTLRTYGKRPRVRQKGSSDGQETSKRRKVSEDPVFRTPSPTRTEKGANTDTDVEESPTPVKPRVSRTYGTPSGTPSKLVRDLSGIFDSMSPGNRSPSMTPTRLAKRMLGRSRTESSVGSQSPVKEQQSKGIDRTSSLPILPSSSSSARATPDRPSNDNSNSNLSLSRPTIFPSVSKGSTTRTYAGKYRSFLMALPASSDPTSLSKSLTNEDEFETRESYSSLRSRWGVDNSEDDPHPSYDISSPSNSTTTASEASPSRNGSGKGKAAIRTVPVPTGMMNPLKSISELRNKGESRRFLDEVGYLFEGLDPKCGIALRRSSALEITTKLCDPEFTRKAKAADFFGKTWELLLLAGAGKGEDKILDVLLVFFLALIARDPVSLAELAERPTTNSPSSAAPLEPHHDSVQDTYLVDILICILENVSSKGDLLAHSDQNSRPSGGEDVKRPVIPKKDRTILYSIIKVITSKSDLIPPYTPISTPLLITLTLQTLPSSCLSASCLPTLIDSLRRCLAPYSNSGMDPDEPSTTSLYTSLSSESRWLDIVKCVPYESVFHHLKLLDAYLVGQWTSIGHGADPGWEEHEVEGHRFLDKARDKWMVRDLVALGVCCELRIREEEEDGDDTKADDENTAAHQKCFILTLRVLISLTHNDKGWARGVVGCGMAMGLILRAVWKVGRELLCVREDEEAKEGEDGRNVENERDGGSHAFDTLCLVLGLLTNVVQVVDDAKDVVRRTRLDPSCALRDRACLKRCVCVQKHQKQKEHADGKERNGVEMLVWLYEQLQLQREGGKPQRKEQTPEQEQENEAQFSFLCGNLSVLFGLLMMGESGVENQGVILGSDAPPRPTSRPQPKRERKGERHQRRVVDEDEDEDQDGTRLKLARLADQAREFGAFYNVVSRRMTRMTHGHGYGYGRAASASAWGGFVGCDVSGTGAGQEGCDVEGEGEEQEQPEEGGSKVVQHVVEFLDVLKDGLGAR